MKQNGDVIAQLKQAKADHLDAIQKIDTALTALQGYVWSTADKKSLTLPAPTKRARPAKRKHKRLPTNIVRDAIVAVMDDPAKDVWTLDEIAKQTHHLFLIAHNRRVPMRKIRQGVHNQVTRKRIVRHVDADGNATFTRAH